jgi:hypothetical protein
MKLLLEKKTYSCCFTRWKKLQAVLTCVHYAPKGKSEHHQDMEYKQPASANNVTSHCATLATFWSTREKRILTFKIEA